MMQKILLVEDEEIIGAIYQRKLQRAGYLVQLCQNIEDAIKSIKANSPDLIFLDHGLRNSKKTGLDLIPELKKLVPQAKVIILSNYSDFQLKKEVKEKGGDDYLVKLNTPPKELIEYIEKL